eukprot:439379_1
MPSLKRSAAKNVDQDTKDLVFGFIRDIQKLLKDENDHIYQSPMIITHLCLMYYYLSEHFTKSGANIKILNKPRNRIQKQPSGEYWSPNHNTLNTAYGHVNIYGTTNNLFVWKLKMMKISRDEWDSMNSNIKIGIHAHKSDGFTCRVNNYYTIDELGRPDPSIGLGLSNIAFSDWIRAPYIETGDVVTMILNEQDKTLRFYVTDGKNIVKTVPRPGPPTEFETRDITFHNIRFRDTEHNSIHYNLAIMLKANRDSIKLIHFSQTKLPKIKSNIQQRIGGILQGACVEVYDQIFATGKQRNKQISFMFCAMCMFLLKEKFVNFFSN